MSPGQHTLIAEAGNGCRATVCCAPSSRMLAPMPQSMAMGMRDVAGCRQATASHPMASSQAMVTSSCSTATHVRACGGAACTAGSSYAAHALSSCPLLQQRASQDAAAAGESAVEPSLLSSVQCRGLRQLTSLPCKVCLAGHLQRLQLPSLLLTIAQRAHGKRQGG